MFLQIDFEDVSALNSHRLSSTTEYWTKQKRSKSRPKWDFICWYEGDCKKWNSKDRADADKRNSYPDNFADA